MHATDHHTGLPTSHLASLVSLAGLIMGVAFSPVHAKTAKPAYEICNQTSYIVNAAIGITLKNKTATQGWFQINPGACQTIFADKRLGDRLFLTAEALPFYAAPPLSRVADRSFCVSPHGQSFLIAGAETCRKPGEFMTNFADVTPEDGTASWSTTLTEARRYTRKQAVAAGRQRLLDLAGYSPGTIDGRPGLKTKAAEAALALHLGLPQPIDDQTLFFSLSRKLSKQDSEQPGLKLCNATNGPLVTAYGLEHANTTTTTGWLRLESGRCMRVVSDPLKNPVYAYAEAVDSFGRPRKTVTEADVFSGNTSLCVQEQAFRYEKANAPCRTGAKVKPFARYRPDARYGGLTVTFGSQTRQNRLDKN